MEQQLNRNDLLKLLAEKEAQIEALTKEIERLHPKELFADAVMASKTSILIGDLAKILKQNGYDTGQKRLFKQLREDGYLIKKGASKNMPTQKAMKLGLFDIKGSTVTNPDGSIRSNKTTKVTGKGQFYFIHNYVLNGKEKVKDRSQ